MKIHWIRILLKIEKNFLKAFVNYLKGNFGCEPQDIKVWLCPAPGKDLYPIWALNNKGMKEVTFEQLLHAGILIKNITNDSTETDKNDHYFSHSQFLKGNQETDGDHAMVAMIRA